MASSIRIDENCMSLEVNGSVITAASRARNLWRMTGGPAP